MLALVQNPFSLAAKLRWDRPRLLVSVCALFAVTCSWAEEPDQEQNPWRFCHAVKSSYVENEQDKVPLNGFYFEADRASFDTDGRYEFWGDVRGWGQGQRIQAQRLVVFSEEEKAVADSGLQLDAVDYSLQGAEAELHYRHDKAWLSDTRLQWFPRHMRAQAQTLHMESKTRMKMRRVKLTTCDEGRDDWYLNASRVKLDQEKGFGQASHVYLTLFGAPVLYLPYISFPIDDRRKTGFLYPSFDYSSEDGFAVAMPYYINLAPNYDATLTPHWITKRGTKLDTQFRYLSRQHRGDIDYHWLPEDRLHDDDTRSLINWVHRWSNGKAWRARADFADVSDRDYFRDLGSDINLSARTYLDRRFAMHYQPVESPLHVSLEAHDFRLLDEDEAAPYELKPRLALAWGERIQTSPFSISLSSHASRFEHDTRVEGERYHAAPRIQSSWQRSWGYAIARYDYHYTQYRLHAQDALEEDNFSRKVPVTVLDQGLFAEKEYTFGEQRFLHTLEPRLLYLYVPYRDQAHIPDFDTSEPELSYARLFKDNRFSGGDRFGDANQVSYGLTSRWLSQRTGEELLRFSVGQTLYFQDLRVTLNDEDIDQRRSSPLVSEAVFTLNRHWYLKGELIWDDRERVSDKKSVSLRYKNGTRKAFVVNYRFRENDAEELDIAAFWPLGRRWQVIGRWWQDLESKNTTEILSGFEYEHCCWTARIVQRRFRNHRDNAAFSNRWLFEFELKGLSSVGRSIERLLAERGLL